MYIYIHIFVDYAFVALTHYTDAYRSQLRAVGSSNIIIIIVIVISIGDCRESRVQVCLFDTRQGRASLLALGKKWESIFKSSSRSAFRECRAESDGALVQRTLVECR